MLVKKRSGMAVEYDESKIVTTAMLACINKYDLVDVDEILQGVDLKLYDGISTREIHQALVLSTVGLIEDTPSGYQYQFVASALLKMLLYKDVYKRSTPWKLQQLLNNNFNLGKYESNLSGIYSEGEIDELCQYIDRDRDYLFTYAGLQQMIDKYLVQDRVTSLIYETPQDAFMLIGMFMFQRYEGVKRMEYVKRFYDAVSTFKINLPTPIMAGVRCHNQFSSCCVVDIGDDLSSILSGNSAVGKYTASRAGIGINFSRVRGINAKIRGGEVIHSGITPLLRVYANITRSLMQGGIRGGSSTTTLAWWHWEIETFLNLKTNKGTAENSIREMDYSIAFTHLLRDRILNNKDITLFSPEEVPDLLEATFSGSTSHFKEIYERYEADPNIRKKVIGSRELYYLFLTNRFETGRIYTFNSDHINHHTPLLEPIVMSNLCQELASHTKPLVDLDLDYRIQYEKVEPGDNEKLMEWEGGEIAMCTLSNVNLGSLDDISEIPALTDLIVRFLDELLDYQDYPVLEARVSTFKNRYLGIGVSDVFHLLEKNFVNYDTQAGRDLFHKWMEHFQYYTMQASVGLAKEKGCAPNFVNTKRHSGIMPIDTYNKNVDSLVSVGLELDWAQLSADCEEYGMRNNTLTMIPPAASSSIVSNTTPGVDVPRRRLIHKTSKRGSLPQLVSEGDKYQYVDLAWGVDNLSYIKFLSVAQKFLDQSISTNLYYVPSHYEGNKVPMSKLVSDDMAAYRYGLKTLYYLNTTDDEGDADDSGCIGGACEV